MFYVTDILQKEPPVNISLSSKPIENRESRTIFFALVPRWKWLGGN